MKLIVIKKGSFEVTTLSGVSAIAYSSGTITITHGGGSSSYTFADYMFQIIAEEVLRCFGINSPIPIFTSSILIG